MQIPEPTVEHKWLMQLLGDWEFEHECNMGPDQPPMKSSGKQSTRALGAFWTLGKMEHRVPDGQPASSLITLGFDPDLGKFVGSFVTSCMTRLWPYEGSLDANRRILTLDSEGPSITGDGSMAKYQDIIEVVDEDHYLFSSRFQNPDGSWAPFMYGKHTRKK